MGAALVADTESSPPVLLNVSRRWTSGADVTELAARVHAAGLDGVGLPDSSRLMTDCLIETERILSSVPVRLAGPSVLSLGLRPPATVAGAVRTLEAAHGERVMLVVGRGESSLQNEKLPIPTLAEYERLQRQLMDVLGNRDGGVRPIGAGSGPRTIASTAQILGGVLLDVGTDLEVIRRAVEHARAADPRVRIWIFTRIVVGGTDQERRAAIEPVLGSCATRVVRAPEWYGITPDDRELLVKLVDSYDYALHGTDQPLATDAGLASAQSLIRDRFFVTGERDAAEQHLRELAQLRVDGVIVAGLPGVIDRVDELGLAVANTFG